MDLSCFHQDGAPNLVEFRECTGKSGIGWAGPSASFVTEQLTWACRSTLLCLPRSRAHAASAAASTNIRLDHSSSSNPPDALTRLDLVECTNASAPPPVRA